MRMQPIFLVLSVAALAALAWTFSLGWRYHYGHAELAERAAAGEMVTEAQYEARVGGLIGSHFVWGMGSGVFVCFVHSLVLVYFLGTGKAIKEQIELQGWESDVHDESKRYMGQAVAPTVIGIALVILAAFSGGFALIQALHPDAHMVIALVGSAGQAPIFAWEFAVIRKNGRLMDRVVDRLEGENIRIAL